MYVFKKGTSAGRKEMKELVSAMPSTRHPAMHATPDPMPSCNLPASAQTPQHKKQACAKNRPGHTVPWPRLAPTASCLSPQTACSTLTMTSFLLPLLPPSCSAAGRQGRQPLRDGSPGPERPARSHHHHQSVPGARPPFGRWPAPPPPHWGGPSLVLPPLPCSPCTCPARS